MMEELFDKLSRVISGKSALEIEARFYIDERKKPDAYSRTYSPEQTTAIAKALIEKYAKEPSSISQTINFTVDDKVKQLVFVNGEQQKDKLTHYSKKKLIQPILFLHNDLPAYRFSASFETPIGEFSVTEAKAARIRLRYTIKLDDWQLDITLIKNIPDFSNPALLKSEKTRMLFPIDVKSFASSAPWSIADLIEVEMEFIGKEFNIDKLQLVDKIFDQVIDSNTTVGYSNEKGNSNLYQSAIYSVAKYLKPNEAHRFRDRDGIKQLSNQVIELDKNLYLKDVAENILNYYITDKIDGTRAILYIHDGVCDVITKDLKTFEVKTDGVYIFDAEEYDSSTTQNETSSIKSIVYYIFDVMVFDGKNISDLPFDERLKYFEKSTIADNFKLKPFIKLTDKYRDEIRKFKKAAKPYEIDGIILTPADGKYNTMQVYKYKPVNKLSIDFLMKKCPDKLLGIIPYVKKQGKTLYLLFSGVQSYVFRMLRMKFVKHYEDIFPGISTRSLPNYIPVQFQPSDNTYSYLYWDDRDNLDGEIGEFVCDECLKEEKSTDLWNLHRLRSDRKVEVQRGNYFGNNYKVAELTWMSYKTPLIIEDIDSDTSYFKEHDNQLQKASRNFNSFVKARIFEQYKNTEWIMDLASGKGQDLFRYASIGTKNVVFTEYDSVALLELIQRKHSGKLANPMNVLIHQLDLNEKYTENIQRLNDIELPSDGLNVIMCHFAFHYLIANDKALVNIIKFITHYLKKGGRFVFTAFDARAVISLLNDHNGNWTVKSGNEIKYSIKKQYTTTYLEPIGQKIDVMLPFSADKYYSEYLVNIDYISKIFEKHGFTLEIDQTFGEHLDDYKLSNRNGFTLMDADDKKFSSLYHYYSLYKNK